MSMTKEDYLQKANGVEVVINDWVKRELSYDKGIRLKFWSEMKLFGPSAHMEKYFDEGIMIEMRKQSDSSETNHYEKPVTFIKNKGLNKLM